MARNDENQEAKNICPYCGEDVSTHIGLMCYWDPLNPLGYKADWEDADNARKQKKERQEKQVTEPIKEENTKPPSASKAILILLGAAVFGCLFMALANYINWIFGALVLLLILVFSSN